MPGRIMASLTAYGPICDAFCRVKKNGAFVYSPCELCVGVWEEGWQDGTLTCLAKNVQLLELGPPT